MYNLVVLGNPDGYSGEPITLDVGRCVREYTDEALTAKYGAFDDAAIAELTKLPTIFACENGWNVNPRFGTITDITYRRALGQVRLDYEFMPVDPFLTHDQLAALGFELDISNWELNRTHWALKEANLPKELHRQGIVLPDWTRTVGKVVDVAVHDFQVGLSFPGEVRPVVEAIAQRLERAIGPHSYFYDRNYVAQLARPNLDVLLQDIYRNRSKLVVVFIGGEYQQKDWCGIEWRAIRQIVTERQDDNRIMFIRTDDGDVDGVFRTDGFVDARFYDAQTLADMIVARIGILP